jgi:hypothetical protein
MKDKNVEITMNLTKQILDVFKENTSDLDCETAINIAFTSLHLVVVNIVNNFINGTKENKISAIKEIYTKLSNEVAININ